MFIVMLWAAVTLQGENGEEKRGRKKGEEGKGQKQLSAAQIPSYLLSFPAVFTLFSRLKTRS